VVVISLFLCLLQKLKLFIFKILYIMSRKYKISESQLTKIYERLTLSEQMNDEEMMEETSMEDEDVKTESEKPWDKTKKSQAPETKKHMVGKMHEELGQSKFSGKSVNGGVATKEWEKATKPGKTAADGIKSGGSSKNIEGTKANNGQWADVKKSSPDASKHIVKGMKGGEVKNSMGAKKPASKAWEEAPVSQAPEAKAHVKGSLKNQGGEKKIESAKARTVNETAKDASMTPSQMRDKKKSSMEEMAKRLDKEAGK